MSPSDTTFFRRFGAARRAKGLRQTEVAKSIGARQSAISMFEGGRPDALSDEKIRLYAELVGLKVEAAEIERAAGRVSGQGCLKFCPQAECSGNVPQWIGGEAQVRPGFVKAPEGARTRCRWCGELLEEACPECGVALVDAPVCDGCGVRLVDPGPLAEPDPEAWVHARRAMVAEDRQLIVFVE